MTGRPRGPGALLLAWTGDPAMAAVALHARRAGKAVVLAAPDLEAAQAAAARLGAAATGLDPRDPAMWRNAARFAAEAGGLLTASVLCPGPCVGEDDSDPVGGPLARLACAHGALAGSSARIVQLTTAAAWVPDPALPVASARDHALRAWIAAQTGSALPLTLLSVPATAFAEAGRDADEAGAAALHAVRLGLDRLAVPGGLRHIAQRIAAVAPGR